MTSACNSYSVNTSGYCISRGVNTSAFGAGTYIYPTTNIFNNSYSFSSSLFPDDKQKAKTLFAKYFPILKYIAGMKKRPTKDLMDIYSRVVGELPTILDFKKTMARNEAVFDLINGNSTIYLIYSKSEDSFVSAFANEFLMNIPI